MDKPEVGVVRATGVGLMWMGILAIAGCHPAAPPPAPAAWAIEHVAHPSDAQELKVAKDLFYKSVDGDKAALAPAITMLNDLGGAKSNNPEVVAYSGAAELLRAKRTDWILEKAQLSHDALALEDKAVLRAPGNLEIRFLRGVTNYELPGFLGRHTTAESDLAYVARFAESAVPSGRLDRRAAAADLDYYGKSLEQKFQNDAAIEAWRAAIRVDPQSNGAKDAMKHLAEHHVSP
jgi:tetratricopeptide (TPR) repeat protein